MDSPTGTGRDVNIDSFNQSVVSSLTETSSLTTSNNTSTSISTTATVQKKRNKRGKGTIGDWRKLGKKSSLQYTPVPPKGR